MKLKSKVKTIDDYCDTEKGTFKKRIANQQFLDALKAAATEARARCSTMSRAQRIECIEVAREIIRQAIL